MAEQARQRLLCRGSHNEDRQANAHMDYSAKDLSVLAKWRNASTGHVHFLTALAVWFDRDLSPAVLVLYRDVLSWSRPVV
jgi:hypothetical protein